MAYEAPTSSVAPSNGWLITRNHLVESICRHQASESIPQLVTGTSKIVILL